MSTPIRPAPCPPALRRADKRSSTRMPVWQRRQLLAATGGDGRRAVGTLGPRAMGADRRHAEARRHAHHRRRRRPHRPGSGDHRCLLLLRLHCACSTPACCAGTPTCRWNPTWPPAYITPNETTYIFRLRQGREVPQRPGLLGRGREGTPSTASLDPASASPSASAVRR